MEIEQINKINLLYFNFIDIKSDQNPIKFAAVPDFKLTNIWKWKGPRTRALLLKNYNIIKTKIIHKKTNKKRKNLKKTNTK